MPSSRRVLVTGGAGFVGSHVARALALRGDEVVVLDDLSQGHRAAVPAGAELIPASLADRDTIDRVLAHGPWHAVLHFAALSLVGESMADPCRYLLANAGQGIALIDACVRHGVRRFVLSSTANLFGEPDQVPIPESAPIQPSSPYGESKWMLERALSWAERAHGLRYASLRYFNAAGCDPEGHLGEDHDPETHLIPLAIDAALGRRPALTVFGSDYPTADGTAVRDYVHVTDLADAHLLALERVEQGSATYNLGNGTGYSVLEVVRAVEQVSGRAVPRAMGARRAGDPAVLVASSELIRAELGWAPRLSALDEIVRT
ncbi:MAG: UDP-glucose 4-epimerase GalE, partial [Acetobacteraceae bacterium]|nr:UDP-glucose 4-epimerase GalE [Acetobacteraceae bacterium]